ncbi:MAG: hypothetical protein ACTHOC_12730 [Luteimonas sp.]
MDLTSSLLAAVALALLQLALVRMVLGAIHDEAALRLAGGGGLLATVVAAVVWPMATFDFGAFPMVYLATMGVGLALSWFQRTQQLRRSA